MIRHAAGLLVLIGLLGPVPYAQAQGVGPLAPPGAAAEGFPKPSRPVAAIIHHSWGSEEQRTASDENGQIVRLMGLKAGMTVADIGAGSGYHTVRLAPVVGPTGRVIAQDVTPDYLGMLAERVKAAGVGNVTLALGDFHDPRLPPASLDAAILVHMYHEIEQPYAFLYNLVPALKPGARVGVVDLDRPTEQHGTPPALLRCEFESVGYRQVGISELVGGSGYLAIFTAPAPAERRRPSTAC